MLEALPCLNVLSHTGRVVPHPETRKHPCYLRAFFAWVRHPCFRGNSASFEIIQSLPTGLLLIGSRRRRRALACKANKPVQVRLTSMSEEFKLLLRKTNRSTTTSTVQKLKRHNRSPVQTSESPGLTVQKQGEKTTQGTSHTRSRQRMVPVQVSHHNPLSAVTAHPRWETA